MRTTKLWFGLLILFFFVVIALSPLGIKYFMTHENERIITYHQIQSNSCHINAIEPTIILRMDDVRAYSKLTKPLVDEIISRNMSVTLGVIPRDIEKDFRMIKYLKEIKESPYIEIAQHGVYHNETDKDLTNESLLEGYAKIQTSLGVISVTYIPPNNDMSLESKNIVSNYFRIISGEEGIFREGEKYAEIGYTEETYYYDKNEFVPIETIINKCDESLRNTNLCVIAIHPQEYATNINNPIILDKNRFEEYKTLLDELQKLNVKFSTFKDLVVCTPYN